MFKIPQENTCSGDAEKVLSTSAIWIETSSAKRTYRYNYINFCAESESEKSKRYHGLSVSEIPVLYVRLRTLSKIQSNSKKIIDHYIKKCTCSEECQTKEEKTLTVAVSSQTTETASEQFFNALWVQWFVIANHWISKLPNRDLILILHVQKVKEHSPPMMLDASALQPMPQRDPPPQS
nr:hypothetical protein Iba_scaffold30363CG0030 [Ipomoea batatas]GMC61794.1 hypothetical protein Iba_chr02bCG23440 [Ipomoea batatas]